MYRSVWTLSCSPKTRNRHDPFAVKVLKTDEHLLKRISSLCSSLVSESQRTDSEPSLATQHFTFTIMYVRVLKSRCTCAHNITTPTIMLNFLEENFRDQKAIREIHENIVPRKFGATRYYVRLRLQSTVS